MKKNLSKFSNLIAAVAIIGLSWSCTKESPMNSGSSQQTTQTETTLQSNEVSSATVNPGLYGVLKFVDSGDEHTAEFNGYTFRFRSDGVLIATTNTGTIFRGTWKLKNNQTKMELNISGNAALKDLDDDNWNVVKITNTRINLRKPGPDQVIFSRQ